VKSVTGREFCRALERQGWSLVRTSGSHQVWSKQGYPNLSVPVHAGKSLKAGLLAALMRTSGISESDL
jgi:predicted RNA binding protein YcfA (HicA-like mRNA interferase family)